jgi:hypothetical protein
MYSPCDPRLINPILNPLGLRLVSLITGLAHLYGAAMAYAFFNQDHHGNPVTAPHIDVIDDEYYEVDLTRQKKINPNFQYPRENLDELMKVERMLNAISADCDYEQYRNIIWALESTFWWNRYELQYNWSITAPHRFEEAALKKLIASYKHGKFTLGTLVMYAKQAGWDEEKYRIERLINRSNNKWLKKFRGNLDPRINNSDISSIKNNLCPTINLTDPKDKNSKFNPLSIGELLNIPKPPAIIAGLIASKGISAIYGPSGSGKSFAIIDLMCHIATQNTWYGHKIKSCPVTYVALEGVGGVAKRFQAWEERHQVKIPATLKVVTEHLSLLNPEDTKNLANRLNNMGMGTGFIVIDTLNQSAPEADENISKDMGRIISNAQLLQKLTTSHVMLVHHSGKDTAKGLRGHSSLLAALDLAIQVNKSGGKRSWHVAKNKDDIDGKSYFFKLEQVTLGMDEDGELITSCVATPDIFSKSQANKPKPRGPQQAIALMVITRLIQNSAKSSTQHIGRIKTSEAIKEVGDSLLVEDKRRAERAKTAINGLLSLNLLTQDGDLLSLP